jgi:hypothetical protein
MAAGQLYQMESQLVIARGNSRSRPVTHTLKVSHPTGPNLVLDQSGLDA